MKHKLIFLYLFLLILFVSSELVLAQQINPVIINDEKLSYIGMTLSELTERFGIPRTVAAVRGIEIWQDDVVFQYPDADFFIHRDRVWQVRFTTACGISARDRKTQVMAILGETAEDFGEYALMAIPGRNWPVMLRVNFNNSGLVTAVFIYRPDF